VQEGEAMMQYRYINWLVVGLMAVLLSACGTTQVKSVWKDPAYNGRPQRVMVVAVSSEAITRRIVEDEFTLQLKTHGVDAIASYSILPDRSQNDQEIIAKMVVQLGADSVLISRLVSKRSVRVYYPANVAHRPPYYSKWHTYYRDGYEMINTPGYSTKYEYALMETNLYDASSENLLWAATTETGVNNLNQVLIKPYIGSILNIMVESGLIRDIKN
jgi:hypothetical protein